MPAFNDDMKFGIRPCDLFLSHRSTAILYLSILFEVSSSHWVGLLTNDRPRLPDNTQHSPDAYVHSPRWIHIRNPYKRGAKDSHLRTRWHRDRPYGTLLSVKIIIIIIFIIIVIVSFMQGIYTHIPETNYVPREYSVAAILLVLFMVLISLVSVLNLLYFYISTFRSMCAVPNMAVFCSSLTACFSWYVSHVFSE